MPKRSGVEHASSFLTEAALGSFEVVSVLQAAEVARAVESIAQAQTEQLSGITLLDQGIAEISRTTQEAAGQSEQVAATARQSADEVATLKQTVERFSIA